MKTSTHRKALVALMIIAVASPVSSSYYDFSWGNRNHMRGAFWMCATTGFTKGKCPKVLTKCWLPPMIYYTPEGQVRSHCTKLPKFSWSSGDLKKVRRDAWRKLGYEDEPPECEPCEKYLKESK